MSDKLTNLIIKGLQGHRLDRRTFLKLGGISGAGFVLASALPKTANATDQPSLVGSVDLNAYVSVGDDGKIVILSGSPEMGKDVLIP